MNHTSFATTTRGLNRSLPPMRLYERAKKLGVWNPSEIDFSKDRADWTALTLEEKDLIWRLLGMFVSGEEAVTLDLLPLIRVIAAEGRIEEEMYLTTFLFEEAKHTDFFRRFLDEVAVFPSSSASFSQPESSSLERYHSENYRRIFYEALPQALLALENDASPAAQARASVTYNMVVEGVLAETGYHAFFTALQRQNLMPGLRKGIALLKQDESRHIAYGIYLLSRLVAEHPAVWDELQAQMNTLLPYAIGVIGDAFAAYTVVPFGLVEEDFIEYAMNQFSKRAERLEKARGASLDEIHRVTQSVIERDDA
ncbi:MAG: R2-like ligand-binding oxidase [Anaerolineales bacterium]|nr:R2-like ligand-binding oxidase [Anaerolineales bacterium]MCX7754377.1 R2-like ligand-binding oxidase [Anaerolineales bacterium]MDW8277899.1 R2-like ligand-binding oxidase [Anaerolineales bacterium]